MVRRPRPAGLLILALLAALGLAPGAGGQHRHGPDAAGPTPGPPEGASRSRRVTMEELHRTGGVPRGWKFSVPAGDAARGRQLFADLECYRCHTVAGERFPESGRDPREVGPPLTGVGAHHPAEYIAESILDPNAVIVAGPGYTGPDGRSIMPSYADSLTLAQWIDLVAYLKSLTGGEAHAAEAVREARVGDYRIRLVFATGHAPGTPGGAHAHAPGPGSAGPGRGHLMAFITDVETDEPVPYLPVTAVLHGAGGAGPAVRLEPMLGSAGFHYGADVALPRDLRRITLAINPPTVKVLGPRRFASPVKAVIDWAPPAR
jgi:mono/diheme cytochrome c family protein